MRWQKLCADRFLRLSVSCALGSTIACQKKAEESISETTYSSNSSATRYLYVATGSCFSGTGNTTFTAATASNLIYRLRLDTGVKDMTLADYNAPPANPGDTPVSITKKDAGNIYVMVENTSGRRVERIPKSYQGDRTTFYNNTTGLSAVLRNIITLSDGSLLLSKSTAIEKLNSLAQRQTVGASLPFVSAPAGVCGTSTTLITSVNVLSNGKIVFTHAAASQNRFAIISANGYSAASDCLAAQTSPIAAASPTAAVYLSSDSQLLVAYAGNAATTDINSIYSYTIDETTNAVTTPTKLIDSPSANYVYGISAMAYDSQNKYLYVAASNSVATTIPNYNIEKFSYDPTTRVLTRVGSTPFYTYGFDTKCISSMMIDN